MCITGGMFIFLSCSNRTAQFLIITRVFLDEEESESEIIFTNICLLNGFFLSFSNSKKAITYLFGFEFIFVMSTHNTYDISCTIQDIKDELKDNL